MQLAPDKTGPEGDVLHTLQRVQDKDLPNLVDGTVYFVVNRAAGSFQLEASVGGGAIALNAVRLVLGGRKRVAAPVAKVGAITSA